MFTRVSVLIPTRRRLARLHTLLSSYEDTTRGVETHSELVFRTDDDDPMSTALLRNAGHVVVVGPRFRGYDSMPTFFNEMTVVATGDVLMCGNDDMIFRTPRWAPRVLDEASRYPDGLFNLGVSTHNEDHFPFSVVSRKVVDQLGFIWDPRIFWGDIYLRDVMAFFGRTVKLPDVTVEHDWAGKKPDEVFLQADKDIVRRNPRYWSDVHAPAVQEAIGSLKGLLS